MGSASITIAVNGKWNGSALDQATKSVQALGKAAGDSAASVASALARQEAQARRISVMAASTSKSTTKGLMDAANELVAAGGKIYAFGEKVEAAGQTLTRSVTVPMVAIGAYAATAAVKYDTALANVRKTSDLTESALERLGESAIELSTTQPVSAEQILNVEALGAQLGIADEKLEDFAMTAAGLDIATNMDAETAATQMARFANITGMADDKMENYASTLVAIGNNMATTESEVSNMALRLASAGHQAGMSESEILGLSGAMSSLGIRAEMGGSAMSQVLVKISKAVSEGGNTLNDFAAAANMSADEFAAAWQNEPVVALEALLTGIGQAAEGGADMNTILGELGITEIRQSDVMRRLAGSYDLVAESVDLATGAWEENTALQNEVDARNESMAARLQVLKNKLDEVAITVGVPLVNAAIAFLGAAQPVIDVVADAAQSFADMDEEGQRAVLALAAIAAGAGPVLTVAGNIAKAVGGAVTSLGRLGQSIGVYGDALRTVDGAQIRTYSGAQTLATNLGLAGNKAVEAAGGVENYVSAWEASYSAQKQANTLTQKADALEAKLKTSTDKGTDSIKQRVAQLRADAAAAEVTHQENQALLDAWQAQASGAKTSAKAIGEAAEATSDIADAAGDAQRAASTTGKSMSSLGKAGQTVADGAVLAAGGFKALVASALPIVAVTAGITLLGAAVSFAAQNFQEAAEREETMAEVSATFADVAGEAAASAESQAASVETLGDKLEKAAQSHEELNGKVSDTMLEYETNAKTLDEYTSTIENLTSKSRLSISDQERLKTAVKGYNDITGESIEVTDAAAGKLSESTDDILENAEAWKANAEAQALQELATEYTKQQVQDRMNLAAANDELAAAEARYNDVLEQWNYENENQQMVSQETADALRDAGSALDEARDKQEQAQAAYDSSTESLEQLNTQQVLATDSGKALKEAISGMDGVGDALAAQGIGIDEFSAALANAGITTKQLNEIGSANLAALAESCNGDMELMTWAIQNWNNVPFENKDGSVNVNDAQLRDAQGNVYTWNGTEFVDKNGRVAVNDQQLIDAQGRVWTWDKGGRKLVNKSGRAYVSGNIEWANDQVTKFLNSPYNLGTKTAGVIVNGLSSLRELRRLAGYAAGGIRTHADGGIRYHAGGSIVSAPRYGYPLDLVGEAGAEAIVPLTNKRYAMPFVSMISDDVAKKAAKNVPQQQPSQTTISYVYNLTMDGTAMNMTDRAMRLVSELVDEFNLTASMGVR